MVGRGIAADRSYKRWRWTTFAVTWLIYASLYLTRKSFAVAKVAFPEDASVTLTRADLGRIDSYYLTAYMAGQFLFGPLGDRLGPRRILLAGMALSVATAIAYGFSTGFVVMAVLAAVQGIAQATGWSNTAKVMSSWFSLRERGRVIGWWCTHYSVGAAVALPLAGYMMTRFGSPRPPGEEGSAIVPYWQAAFWGPAALLAIVLLISWRFLRNRPQDVGLPSIEEYHDEGESVIVEGDDPDEEPEGSWTVIAAVLRVPGIWLLAISYFSVKLTRYALYFWGPKYIHESLGADAQASTIIAAALPIGGTIGVIATGYISDYCFQSRRAPVAILSLIATAAILLTGLTPIANTWLMAALFFSIGLFLFGPDTLISGTAAIDLGTKKGAATAAGFVNGVGSLGGILGGYLPGVLTSEEDWTQMFYVFVVGILISAAVLSPLWNTKPRTVEKLE
ncbi:MFS transporter [Pirellulales bacterium]|nr:MFS transporter [Pirellulales bacterium]